VSSTVRLGTRGSPLAVWQSEHVRRLLAIQRPHQQFEVVVIDTTGDRILDTPLPMIGGKGVFTAELEQALLEGSIDLAVHSLKDLPTTSPPGLAVGAVTERANPADALVSRRDYTVAFLPKGARVGTSSSRRAAQLLRSRPDLEIIDLRGNAGTRLRKALDPSGPYDAIVMALAALHRLERTEVVSEIVSEHVMLPAPGQGAIAVQCRDEEGGFALVRGIDHGPTALETVAERAFLEGLGGGCAVPVAARARLGEKDRLHVQGRVLSVDGSRVVEVESVGQVAADVEGKETAYAVGRALAEEALANGAGELLAGVADGINQVEP